MKPIDKVITLIKEMMVANAPGTSGAYTSKGDAEVAAGFDAPLGLDGRSKIARRLPPAYRRVLSKNKKKNKY